MFGFEDFAEKGRPLVSDMKAKGVPGVLFEINFSAQCAHMCRSVPLMPADPFSPPFFRFVIAQEAAHADVASAIWPRFLPFAHGGGGHVTGAAASLSSG